MRMRDSLLLYMVAGAAAGFVISIMILLIVVGLK